MNLPPSWPRMSSHARACYLVDCKICRTYTEARRKVGRMEREERGKVVAVAPKNLWWLKD